MEEIGHQYRKLTHAIDEASSVQHGIESLHQADLRYSSPKPWILALGLSLALWAAIAGVLWALFK
jgi:hypothetical protein